nr:serine hydrolase domain-containing protein [Kibdelosporangium sp. MJ126-NF4]CEL19501.1 Beta-lactamase [Kibdelosporangium sp. MJ126-NF4]CTQ94700.1 Beta-lactamase (EC 3.5.2.6) [Kibdelosporangium sp. MJ126-NF4]
MLPTTELALLRRVAHEQATCRAPSLVAAVVRADGLVWSGARGRVDGELPGPDTQYRIGSITKTFIAMLVMRLRDEGKLDLNDSLDKHVPGTVVGDRTIAQLLSHTSGLTSESPGKWWERSPGADWAALHASLGPETVVLRAGSKLHYSNVGFGVLGELVARHRGMSWLDAVRAELLAPLEMTRTTPHPQAPNALGWAVHPHADVLLPEPTPDAGAMAPAGQLWSTLNDLSRWLRLIAGDTGDVLHPDTVAEMRAPAMVDDGDNWLMGFGLGLQIARDSGRRMAGHTGSMPGFLACALTDTGSGTGALVLANCTAGVGVVGLSYDLMKIADEHEPLLPAEWAPASTVNQDLLDLTGVWYWGPAVYQLRLLDQAWLELVPIQGAGRASRFRPAGDGTWTGIDAYYAGETLKVTRDSDGGVSHLDLATFIFTRRPYDPAGPIPGGVDPHGWGTRR